MNTALKFEKYFAYILYYTGLFFVYGKMKNISNKTRILMYHRVVEDTQAKNDVLPKMVTKDEFENQMRYISLKYRPISLNQFLDDAKKGKIKKKSIVITMDDGYKDNYTNAYPILTKYNVPASIFLTSGLIDTDKMLWFDEVSAMICSTKKMEIKIQNRIFNISSNEKKTSSIQNIISMLKKTDNEERLRWIKELQKECRTSKNLNNKNTMLSWKEVKEMSKNKLITFGAHTQTHPILSKMNLKDVENEIAKSKQIIGIKTGIEPGLFSYPNGGKEDFNKDIKRILKKYDFKCATSTISGLNDKNCDLFELKRIGCSHENDNIVFKVKISGIFNTVISIYKLFIKVINK
ncbi:MAG: polysaccharide deacetylase family protein [Nanohaloarchaea archaeon]|nr:polysaccharide deacetylase family protein [Candidatus Nanohaloarchaea archaeon]